MTDWPPYPEWKQHGVDLNTQFETRRANGIELLFTTSIGTTKWRIKCSNLTSLRWRVDVVLEQTHQDNPFDAIRMNWLQLELQGGLTHEEALCAIELFKMKALTYATEEVL